MDGSKLVGIYLESHTNLPQDTSLDSGYITSTGDEVTAMYVQLGAHCIS